MTKPTLTDQMRRNPAGDWTIADIERACRQAGVRCVPPTGSGSHYKVSHPSQAEILTIPARKPVKPINIKKLAAFLASVGG